MTNVNVSKLRSQVQAFVQSGFKQSKFTTSIYEALHIHSGIFIAHFNKDGFYKARFSTQENIDLTIESLKELRPKKDEIKQVLAYIPSLLAEIEKTYKIGEPVFRYVNGRCGVFFDTSIKYDTVLNLTGGSSAYSSRGVGIYKTILELTSTPILTNNDCIAFDWILNLPEQGLRINKSRLVIFVHTGTNYETNGGHIGASPQRLKLAQEKMKKLGYKTKYFSSLKTAEAFINKMKVMA